MPILPPPPEPMMTPLRIVTEEVSLYMPTPAGPPEQLPMTMTSFIVGVEPMFHMPRAVLQKEMEIPAAMTLFMVGEEFSLTIPVADVTKRLWAVAATNVNVGIELLVL